MKWIVEGVVLVIKAALDSASGHAAVEWHKWEQFAEECIEVDCQWVAVTEPYLCCKR